jgi:hypothetical protein
VGTNGQERTFTDDGVFCFQNLDNSIDGVFCDAIAFTIIVELMLSFGVGSQVPYEPDHRARLDDTVSFFSVDFV